MASIVKTYYRLTKPGIVYGNTMTAAAGFLLASRGNIDFLKLLATLFGTALIIAAACVINNYIDRDIDANMKRTKKRALVTGKISGKQALTFAGALGIIGFTTLATQTNMLTVLVGLVGILDYVVFYTWSKRHTQFATLVGSISGATSITAGYTAAANVFDTGAILVFLAMVVWQMPHFYSIAIFRRDEYAAAKIPVLPIVKGIRRAKVEILLYIIAYAVAIGALTIFDVTGYTFVIIMLLFSSFWFWRGLEGFAANDDKHWARKMFGFSLLVLLAFSALLSIDSWLP